MISPRPPTVTNIRGGRHPYNVFIGRPSKWGNPFHEGRDGTRAEVIARYEGYVCENERLLRDLIELNGKVLGCYCDPKPCHGQVLVKLFGEHVVNCGDCGKCFARINLPVNDEAPLCEKCFDQQSQKLGKS